MIKCLMLYQRATTNPNNTAFEWLQDEAQRVGINLTIAFIEDVTLSYNNNAQLLINKKIIPNPDCVIIRGYNAEISMHFQNQNVWMLNPWQSMQNSLNKVLTHQILTEADIPTPQTIYSAQANYDFPSLCESFRDNQFIVKKIDGSKGENVFLVNNPHQLAQAIKLCDKQCLCQKFIASSRGRDIRVWVIGGKVAGAVERRNETSFLSNFSQGGTARLIEISDEIRSLAIRSAAAVGLGFAGIDILYDNNGYNVCEVNGNAGFRTISLYESNGQNSIPRQLFQHISNVLQ